MNGEEIDVWHLEYVTFDARTWAWQPVIVVVGSQAAAEAQRDALLKARSKANQCFRITGQHKHLMPTEWPT